MGDSEQNPLLDDGEVRNVLDITIECTCGARIVGLPNFENHVLREHGHEFINQVFDSNGDGIGNGQGGD